MLVHRRVTPSIKFASTHLYTWVERGTVRVKCLAQEHNTMSPARARTWTARSGDECTNHEATAPPTQCYSTPRLLDACAPHNSRSPRSFVPCGFQSTERHARSPSSHLSVCPIHLRCLLLMVVLIGSWPVLNSIHKSLLVITSVGNHLRPIHSQNSPQTLVDESLYFLCFYMLLLENDFSLCFMASLHFVCE